MYLRKTDVGWQYACPDSKCSSTGPYSPAESADRRAQDGDICWSPRRRYVHL